MRISTFHALRSFSIVLRPSLFRVSIVLGLASLAVLPAQGQWTKGSWLVGGTGNFSSSRYTVSSPTTDYESRSRRIGVSPTVGYFLANKLAAGLRTGFIRAANRSWTAPERYVSYSADLGPFLRYYFLDTKKPVNILVDAGYQRSFDWDASNSSQNNKFFAGAGAAVFLSPSVALELIIGQDWEKSASDESAVTGRFRELALNVGFQVYLPGRSRQAAASKTALD